MANILTYEQWVAQKYVQTDYIKAAYAQLKCEEEVIKGNQPTLSDVTGWKNNVPSNIDDVNKRQGYGRYLAENVTGSTEEKVDYMSLTCTQAGGVSMTHYGTNTGTTKPNLQYSTDSGTTWTTWDFTNIALAVGQTVLFKGNNPNGFSHSTTNYSKFVMTGKFTGGGGIMSLINSETPVYEMPCTFCFAMLFKSLTGLTETPILNASTEVPGCYYQMFYGCKNLTKVVCLSTNLMYQYQWLQNANPTGGTIYKNSLATTYPTGAECVNGIPTGYTIVDIPCTVTGYKSTEPYRVVPSPWDATTTPVYARVFVDATCTYSGSTYKINSVIEKVTSNSFSTNTSSSPVTKSIAYTTHGLSGNATVKQFGKVTYEMVDLGLPSGLKWASMNIGATAAQPYGDYYAWGETEPYYSSLTWTTTTSVTATWKTDRQTTGYTTANYYGNLDSIIYDSNLNLYSEYDTAHIVMGGTWRMPTSADCQELISNTTNELYTDSSTGFKYRKFISKSDTSKYILVPLCGIFYAGSLFDAGSYGYFWSSTRYSDVTYAHYLYVYSSDARVSGGSRYLGYAVRGVCS